MAGLTGVASAAPLAFALSPVQLTGGGPVCDVKDESPDYADVDCNAAGVSAYFGSDGTTIGAAIVLEATPRTTTGGQAPILSTTFVVRLGVGGVHRASIGVDGKGTGDSDYVYAGCAGAAAPIYTRNATLALADGSLLVEPDSGGTTRMTFYVPLSELTSCGVTPTTSLAPFVGTSQAGPLDNINKDFFFGRTVDFAAINEPPVADDANADTTQGNAVSIDVLDNDTDAESTPSVGTFDAASAEGGSIVRDGSQLLYTPLAGFTGTDTFTYTATDGTASSNVATVTVEVTATGAGNRAPVADPDGATTPHGTAVTVDVLDGDTDADSDALSVGTFAASSAQSGTVVRDGTGLRYTPVSGFTGTDTFTYTATDGSLSSNVATVTITVNAPANRAPVADDDAGTTLRGTPVTVDVLDGDTDPDGQVLSVGTFDAASAQGGTVVRDGSRLRYTPAADFTGTDTFTYRATDASASSNVATVTITVNAPVLVNTPPVADPDAASTLRGTAVTVDVLDGDTDVDGQVLSVGTFDATSVQGGTVVRDGSRLRYTPAAGFTGTDTFTYRATDGTASSNVATVTITVNAPANTAPVAQDDAYTVTAGTPAAALTPLVNDADADASPLPLSVVELLPLDADVLSPVGALRVRAAIAAPAGLFALAGGVVSYTPPASVPAAVVHEMRYRITDGLSTAVATIRITVLPAAVAGPVNAAPVAGADTAAFDLGAPGAALAVLGNDTDADGDPLTVLSVDTTGTLGTVTLVNGVVTYVPPAIGSAATSDSFTYVVSDGRGGTATAPVTVALTPPAVGGGGVVSPSPSPAPVTPTTPASPAASVAPSAPASPATSPAAALAPTRTVTQPAALPFTGLSADLLLGLGGGMSVLGLFLALTGRRRTEQVR